jgi:translation initiation factor eIF-2B subunit epsilon
LAASKTSAVDLGVEADGVTWDLVNNEDDYIGSSPVNNKNDDDERARLLKERERAFTISSDYQYPKITLLVSDVHSDDHEYDHHQSLQSSDHSQSAGSVPGDHQYYEEQFAGRSSDAITGSTIDNSTSDNNFAKEALEMVKNSINSNHSIDNAALELNSLKFACNASFSDCRLAIIKALLSLTDDKNHAATQSLWTRWSALLQRFVFSSDPDQLQVLNMLSQQCPNLVTFQYIVPVLYQHDVLDGDTICQWHRQSGNSVLVKFVEWLDADDEDEDGESSGEEEVSEDE